MFNLLKRRSKKIDDYNGCLLTITSCITLNHALIARRMTDNYGKMYGYDRTWADLDIKSGVILFERIDEIYYDERLQYGEQRHEDVSDMSEGESGSIAPNDGILQG